MRAGDLVVKTSDDMDPNIGIIVKTPWDEMESIEQVMDASATMTLNDIMNELYVVTIRRDFVWLHYAGGGTGMPTPLEDLRMNRKNTM